jgi:hypothetical protein
MAEHQKSLSFTSVNVDRHVPLLVSKLRSATC